MVLPIVSIVTALVAYGVLPAASSFSSMTIPHDRTFEARSPTISLGLSLAATSSSASGDDLRGIWAEYETINCSDVPTMVIASSVCTFQSSIEGCSDLRSSDSSSQASEGTVVGATGQCTTNLSATLDDLYGDQTYIGVDYYADSSCSDFSTTNVFAADGACHVVSLYDSDTGEHEILSRIAKIWNNGTASVTWYNASDCVGATAYALTYSNEQESTSECQAGTDGTSTIGYSSGVGSSSGVVKEDDGGLSTGAIVGIVVTCVVFLALVAGLVLWRRHRSRRSGGVGGVDGAALQAPETPDKDATLY